MYRRTSQYLLKQVLKALFAIWMMVLAPAGLILLSIIAGMRTWSDHIVDNATFGLWGGFAICLLCTLSMLFYFLYYDKREKDNEL